MAYYNLILQIGSIKREGLNKEHTEWYTLFTFMANDDVTHINTTPDNASMPPQYRLEETCFASAIEQTQEKKREGKKKRFCGTFYKDKWLANQYRKWR